MELKDLVEQVAAKVAERLAEMNVSMESSGTLGHEESQKPKLLILSESHSDSCHQLLEKESIREKFDVICTVDQDYACDLTQVELILVRNLSNTTLSKIALGMGDTPFTQLIIKAILMGKRLIVPCEELELYVYKDTAPKLYYAMMMEKVEGLKKAGVSFCSCHELEASILGETECEKVQNCGTKAEQSEPGSHEAAAVTFTKKILTERDIREADSSGALQIYIGEKTIITDLAREYAERKGISFIKG